MPAGRAPSLLVLVLVALLYFAAGTLALGAAIIHESASPIWPPTGIALAALLVYGYRVWPAILAAAFLVNLTTDGTVASALGIAIGNTVEGVVGAALVDRFAGGVRVFERAAGILKFVALAAMLSTTISATTGVTTLVLTGFAGWTQAGPIWVTWWLGDAAGALIVTPPLVLWSQDRGVRRLQRQALEAGLSTLATILVALLVFHSRLFFPQPMHYPVAFASIPAMIWAAYRFGPRESATLLLVLAAIATWGTLQGDGPFAVGSPNESLLLLQAFLATMAASKLTLAAVAAERRRAADERWRLLGEAEAANRAKDQFLATLSHELRTPLNAMLGWATMLRAGQLDEAKSRRALEAIERNVKLQTKLIDDLLDVSRIVAGKLSIERLPVELAPVVEAAVDAVRPAAADRSIAFDVAVDRRSGWVLGDAARLQQVVVNLLSNAVKFSETGARVSVRLDRVDGQVRLQVSDTGKGIAPELLPRIFERFHQAESASTRAHGGLGLGLAIVRQLVALHGGRVQAVSTGEGLGSTFTVELPAVERARAWGSNGPPEGREAQPSLAGLRILAVDDNADARQLLSAVLATYGAKATVVGSAAEAVARLDEEAFDVLVADIAMPGRDGYELIQSIRAREVGGQRIAALALTAFARREDADRALATGYDAHLVKPIEPGRLAEAVVAVARGRR